MQATADYTDFQYTLFYHHLFIYNIYIQQFSFQLQVCLVDSVFSDVKWGQNLEAESEANFWRLRPKIIMKKLPNNNIRFKIIAEKLTNFPNFTRFLPENCPIT